MENLLNGNDLLNAGYLRGNILGTALKIANSHFTNQPKEDVIV